MDISEKVDVWHYAVRKGGIYYNPACVNRFGTFFKEPTDSTFIHGQTIDRGLVNCEECKRMMGMVQTR